MSLDAELAPRSWATCRGMERIAEEDRRRSAELLALVRSEVRQVRSRADLLAERGQCSALDCTRVARGIGEPPASRLCGRCYSRHGRGVDVWRVAEEGRKSRLRDRSSVKSVQIPCPRCGRFVFASRAGSVCSRCAEQSRGRANR